MAQKENQPRMFYSPREISQILGVAEMTIRKLYRNGTLPHIVLGRKILININDIKMFQRVPDENGVVPPTKSEVQRKITLAKNQALGVTTPEHARRKAAAHARRAAAQDKKND